MIFNERPVLTEEELLRAQEAIRRQLPQPTTTFLVSMGTIESAWWARMQEVEAECAMDELAETPWWRWLRRRTINRQIDRTLRNAESLRQTFGWPT